MFVNSTVYTTVYENYNPIKDYRKEMKFNPYITYMIL